MGAASDLVLILLVASMASPSLAGTAEREVTVEVAAGKEECFYEPVKAGQTVDVDYQVVDGGRHNEIEINFRLIKPDGVPVVADFRRSDNSHRHTVKTAGDYKICFDNTISRFSSKVIFFEVIVESEGDDEDDEDDLAGIFGEDDAAAAAEEALAKYEVKVQDIHAALKSIREKMSRSRRFQDQIRAFELRDRSTAEHNFERVNFWSSVHVFGMLAAGLAQVALVRSLFDEKSALHSVWKKMR